MVQKKIPFFILMHIIKLQQHGPLIILLAYFISFSKYIKMFAMLS